jgi:mono/diheme cytochrome c family protein
MISRSNATLGILLLMVVVMIAFSPVDYSRPNLEILPDMKYSLAYPAFSHNPHFFNGQTWQTAIPETIARGQLPLHYQGTKEDAVRAGAELHNPYTSGFPPTDVQLDQPAPDLLRSSVARGGNLFRIYCVACHGPAGAGDGPVSQRGFPPPPSLLTGNSRQMQDGQLYHILTYGQGNMSPLATQITREQRWDVINFVRQLQGQFSSSAAAEVSSEDRPDASDEP